MGRHARLLERLPHLDLAELRLEWFYYFGRIAERSLSAKFLRLAIGYKAQEHAENASRRCASIRHKAMDYRKDDDDLGRGRSDFLSPGTRLLREYRGIVHEVLVIENGCFVHAGRVCKSLSEVARNITGSPRPGTKFFGLNNSRRHKADG